MKVEYKKEINSVSLILESQKPYHENYEMRMIHENKIDGILSITGRGANGTGRYCYSIEGKISMRALYERSKITYKDIKMFLIQLKCVVGNMEMFLLNENQLILDPDYIYYQDEVFYFCYYPQYEKTLRESFHELTEYFVSQVDYSDPKSIWVAQELHKRTMEENYFMGQVILDVLKMPATEKKKRVRSETKQGIEPEMLLDQKKTLTQKKRWGNWDKLLQSLEDL